MFELFFQQRGNNLLSAVGLKMHFAEGLLLKLYNFFVKPNLFLLDAVR